MSAWSRGLVISIFAGRQLCGIAGCADMANLCLGWCSYRWDICFVLGTVLAIGTQHLVWDSDWQNFHEDSDKFGTKKIAERRNMGINSWLGKCCYFPLAERVFSSACSTTCRFIILDFFSSLQSHDNDITHSNSIKVRVKMISFKLGCNCTYECQKDLLTSSENALSRIIRLENERGFKTHF